MILTLIAKFSLPALLTIASRFMRRIRIVDTVTVDTRTWIAGVNVYVFTKQTMRHHAVVLLTKIHYRIVTLNSTYGTYLQKVFPLHRVCPRIQGYSDI